MSGRQEEFIPTRRSLLTRLKNWDDQGGWQEFFDTYWKLLFNVARKSGLGVEDAEDVVQETILAVARRMPDFRYDPAIGSFKGWLLKVIRRRIVDRFRGLARQPVTVESSSDTRGLETVAAHAQPDLERVWEEEWQRHLLGTAMARVKRQVSARQFQIFDCYVVKNWPAADVAKNLGVTEQQVYLAKYRVGELLKDALRQAETRML